jgi:hypothetical protein
VLRTHSSAPGRFRAVFLITVGILLTPAYLALAGAPGRFVSRGLGGGGAFLGPAINPFSPREIWIGADMSDHLHSTDFSLARGFLPRRSAVGWQT